MTFQDLHLSQLLHLEGEGNFTDAFGSDEVTKIMTLTPWQRSPRPARAIRQTPLAMSAEFDRRHKSK